MFVAPLTLALALAAAEKPIAPAKGKAAARPAPAAAVRLAQLKAVARPVAPIAIPPLGPPGSGSVPATPTLAPGGVGDENFLKNLKIPTTDDALLAFFRKRTPPAPDRDRIVELVKKLGAKDPNDRDAAQGELIAIGQAAVPVLREASNNIDDVEGSSRARTCLQNIEGSNASLIVMNVARLLAARKPTGACEVLIGYLPFAEDDTTYQEVEAALVSVAIRDGKPDPAILKALKDKVALRRASAAQVLAQAGGSALYTAIRPLLKDPKPSVRLKAALGLVGAYDSEAIPVIIDLMGELPAGMRQHAEDYLIQLAGEWAVGGPKGNDATSRRLRRDVWAAWWKGVEPARIAEDLKARTPSDEERDRIVELIGKLDDPSAEVREAASNDLINMGRKASSLLRRAVSRSHPRISVFAGKCLDAIEKDTPDPLPAAATRILALRRPEGTVAALIGYLPFAESDEAMSQIIDILSTIGINGGKADEALVNALGDKLADRRAAAAMALCKGKALAHLADVRKLLGDKDPMVQLRAGQGLASLGQKQAIPVLIGLFKDLPLEQCWEIEDYLAKVAGEKSPNEIVTADATSRTKVIAAWNRWWKENEKGIDLARLDLHNRELGFYLIVENWNPARGRGRVMEVDSHGKVRWEIGDLQWPYDAQLVRGGNLLIVEQQNRVTERDRKGKIVGLDRIIPQVFYVERLRDGSTFVACRNQIQILDPKGAVRLNHTYHVQSIVAARHNRDGSMAYISYSGQYVKLDRNGKQIKTFQLPWWNYSIHGAEILANENVIVSVGNMNKVMEYTPTGKVKWETSVTYPLIPHRLANGNTVVSANNQTAIIEIDSKGKVVKDWKGFSFKPYRVTKR
jgi:HEAT repeat protein